MKPDPSAADPIQEEAATARIGLIDTLTDLPAVAAYLGRVGAKPVNFKTAKVEEVVNGYPKPLGTLTFDEQGTVTPHRDAEPPTPEEQAAIQRAFLGVSFPKPTTLTGIANGPPDCDLKDRNTFVCHDFAGRIEMVQRRYDNRDGTKGFLSYTPFSDGVWRLMEPDKLPFFGLPGWETASTLYLHEGAGAAARIKRLLSGEERGNCPWLEDLRWGHHVGWLGGVFALDKSKWPELASKGWKHVVIVSDNDANGLRAAAQIVPEFTCKVSILRFGQEFGESFDLGNDFPARLFAGGRWRGPSLRDCLHPADQATDRVEVQKEDGTGTRFVSVLRQTFIEQYHIVTETQQVFHKDRASYGQTWKQFNEDVRWRSHEKDTYALLLNHSEAVCQSITYDPASEPGVKMERGQVRWNQYERPRLKPIAGDPQPFFDYIAYLVPEASDQRSLLRWLATVIGSPEIRVRFSLLLISKQQGVGKSTLGSILKLTLGETNVSFPSEKSVADSAFNGWALGVRAIIVNEIYSNGRSTVYDKLKPYVTDTDIQVNRKNLPEINVNNCAVIVACSNSDKALYIPDDDRRWLIPKLTDKIMPESWWAEFYSWLEGDGAGIILHWAQTFPDADRVRTSERAPASSAKAAIINANKSAGRLLAKDFAEAFVDLGERAIVRVSDLQGWIAGKRHMERSNPRLESERTLIDEVEGIAGIHVLKGDKRPRIESRAGTKQTGTKQAVILNFTPGEGETWSKIQDHLKTMEEVGFHVEL